MRYEDVEPAETVDLIETLPAGSAWRAAQHVQDAWTDHDYILAQAADALGVLAHGMRYEGDPEPRPLQRELRRQAEAATPAAKERAASVREKLENTEWMEV